MSSCAPPPQSSAMPGGVDLSKETVITGVASKDDAPLAGAYVRLLDASGEFTAEVITSPDGDFRFFVTPGTWTLSLLHRDGSARQELNIPAVGNHDTKLIVA